jgi:hypothetical protein
MSGATCAIFMMTFNFLHEATKKALRLPESWGERGGQPQPVWILA